MGSRVNNIELFYRVVLGEEKIFLFSRYNNGIVRVDFRVNGKWELNLLMFSRW